MTNLLDALLKSDINVTKELKIPRLNTKIEIKALDIAQLKTLGTGDEDGLKQIVAESETTGVFRNAELMQKHDAMSPQELVGKVLLSGEILKIVTAVQDISGFDLDATIAKAKN